MSRKLLVAGSAVAAATYTAASCARCEKKQPLRVVVVGGGVMGSAAARALSRHQGVHVSLLDAGQPFRSSWGESRIARLSQVDELHLRMMRRAKQLWDEVSAETGRMLLKQTGMLDIGRVTDPYLCAVADTYERCGVEYETFSTPEALSVRFPQLSPQGQEGGLFCREGWVVLACACLEALTDSFAARPGTVLVENDEVVAIDRRLRMVHTEDGQSLPYDRLVLCCGPWTNAVLARASPALAALPLYVTAEQQVYFAPHTEPPSDPTVYSWDALPVMIDSKAKVYAVPHVEGGVAGLKLGQHRVGPVVANDNEHVLAPQTPLPEFLQGREVAPSLPSDLHEGPAEVCREWAAAHMPGVDSRSVLHSYRCMYTMTPDLTFVVGAHPDDPTRIAVGCGFSGEGYKFAPVVGEALAHIALGLPEPVPGMNLRFDPIRFFS